jgi:hypothetical protein
MGVKVKVRWMAEGERTEMVFFFSLYLSYVSGGRLSQADRRKAA